MNRRVLCVDDEPNVLAGLERTLFEHFEVDTAESGPEGLELLEEDGPFAVVVSDMRMPEMNGAEFLSRVKQRAPDTVRILLTGHSDTPSAIAAINEGAIFRFLCKPCPGELLIQSLEMAADQYRLVHAERELLDNTLKGAVDVLSQVLGLVSPAAFSRAGQVDAYVGHMVQALGLEDAWSYRVAASLSQLGCITVPPETVARSIAGQPLDASDQAMLAAHPEAGARLLSSIPRLEPVAAMIGAQADPERAQHPSHRLGASMIRLALDVDRMVAGGRTFEQALSRARRSHHEHLVEALTSFAGHSGVASVRAVTVRELAVGMVLDQEVHTKTGQVVVGADRELNKALIERLANFARGVGIQEPIRVRVSG